MVLVPEISLTPQMIRLMREYFGDTVSVIHSKLTDTERLLQYNLILKGQSKVVVGTRSAVFAPVENLKLIIIDEEHERSFKSENSPRYSAIRVAQFIAKTHGVKLVLSSATPSVESYFLAQKGFYHLHKLEQRYAQLPLPVGGNYRYVSTAACRGHRAGFKCCSPLFGGKQGGGKTEHSFDKPPRIPDNRHLQRVQRAVKVPGLLGKFGKT